MPLKIRAKVVWAVIGDACRFQSSSPRQKNHDPVRETYANDNDSQPACPSDLRGQRSKDLGLKTEDFHLIGFY